MWGAEPGTFVCMYVHNYVGVCGGGAGDVCMYVHNYVGVWGRGRALLLLAVYRTPLSGPLLNPCRSSATSLR